MEMLAYSNSLKPSTSSSLNTDRYILQPLNKQLESQTVDVIRKTLMQLPYDGAELAATRRKLDNFYGSYVRDGSIYIVLFDAINELVIGGVGLVPFAGLDVSEGIGEIRELAVDPELRGKGLGQKLMRAAFEAAMSLNYKRLYLETTEQMAHADELFKRFGFRPVSLHQQDKNKRKEPLIRQAGRPAFYVWEAPLSST